MAKTFKLTINNKDAEILSSISKNGMVESCGGFFSGQMRITKEQAHALITRGLICKNYLLTTISKEWLKKHRQ
jgi:hypothetical protein